MSYREILEDRTIAISTSESPDMAALGLTDDHLRDATAELARHLLALGARLAYGGDLRAGGFSQLLFELVARHRRDVAAGEGVGVTNYLAWPVHIGRSAEDLSETARDLEGSAELICLRVDGSPLSMAERREFGTRLPNEAEWAEGLTSMRLSMLADTDARVVLGGRVDWFMGSMPGIAEEAVVSLENGQPLYLMGGFGGCARDVAEIIGLVEPRTPSGRDWPGQEGLRGFSPDDLRNGLTLEENRTLAMTPHADQAVTLLLSGLVRLATETSVVAARATSAAGGRSSHRRRATAATYDVQPRFEYGSGGLSEGEDLTPSGKDPDDDTLGTVA